jgi:hypothetical protein
VTRVKGNSESFFFHLLHKIFKLQYFQLPNANNTCIAATGLAVCRKTATARFHLTRRSEDYICQSMDSIIDEVFDGTVNDFWLFSIDCMQQNLFLFFVTSN